MCTVNNINGTYLGQSVSFETFPHPTETDTFFGGKRAGGMADISWIDSLPSLTKLPENPTMEDFIKEQARLDLELKLALHDESVQASDRDDKYWEPQDYDKIDPSYLDFLIKNDCRR